ncbi:MAG: hypothetical protein HOQ05_08170 [Corynebacteriales bacterium]|nr:hypothetical protein [Mycobacteriales bacterium]
MDLRSFEKLPYWARLGTVAVAICAVVGVIAFARRGHEPESENPNRQATSTTSTSASPTDEPEPTPVPGTLTKEQLTPALLGPNEVPAGFTESDPPDSDGPDTIPQNDNARCSELLHKTELDAERSPGGEAQRVFTTSEVGPTIVHNVASFKSADDATTAIALLRPLASECTSWTETDKNGATSYTVQELALQSFGEESYAVQLVMEAAGQTWHTQLIATRTGPNASMLALSSPTPLVAEDAVPLAQLASDKLAALPPA